MNSIKEVDIEGKRVLLRTDLNLPVEDGDVQKTVRFERYMDTVQELADRGAKVAILAHQGRPAREDFLSLEKHSEMISNSIGRKVEFIPTFFGKELSESIEEMNNGDIITLQNVRFLSEELQNASPEQHSDDIFVQELSKHFDLYVDDAFSVAHRSHGSMVGFTQTLDSYSGKVMQQEIEGCTEVKENFENGILVLGGEKPADLIGIMEELIEDVDKVLLGGIPGEIALKIKGHKLGQKAEWIDNQGFDSKKAELEQMMDEYEEKIMLPVDVRTESGNYNVDNVPNDQMTWDIGEETAEKFSELITSADSVVMKGPMGAFEDHEKGTKTIIEAIVSSNAYTVLGGGHTSSLISRFGYEMNDFSHVSIAGGAFVRFMSGENLPAIKALEE